MGMISWWSLDKVVGAWEICGQFLQRAGQCMKISGIIPGLVSCPVVEQHVQVVGKKDLGILGSRDGEFWLFSLHPISLPSWLDNLSCLAIDLHRQSVQYPCI
jgi:hypothetical protein